MNESQRADHLQKIISRMADNSFKLKGWCLTLVSALLAIALKSDGSGSVAPMGIALLAILATLIFAALDAYFLALEKGFRALYDAATYPPSIVPPSITARQVARAACRFSVLGLYAGLILMEGLVGSGLLSVVARKIPPLV